MRQRSVLFGLFLAPLVLLSTVGTASATLFTSINTFGNTDGSERCLVGNASNLCTKGGAYKNAFSITHIYETNSAPLTRIGDQHDQVWFSASGYIEVRELAHYLSTHGTSVAGIGTSKATFTAFPAGTEFSSDNKVVGPALPGDVVQSDYIGTRSFLNVNVGTNPFYFLYQSEGKTYSSDNFAGNGFDNGSGGDLDHMVTWSAGFDTDLRGNKAAVYLIAFERANIDDDFQDGVYEIRIPLAVPEPSTYAMLGFGMLLLSWTTMRRRRNH